MGASMKLMTKWLPMSAMPMLRGRTASTCGLGRAWPKQNSTFIAAWISGAMSPPMARVWARWSKVPM